MTYASFVRTRIRELKRAAWEWIRRSLGSPTPRPSEPPPEDRPTPRVDRTKVRSLRPLGPTRESRGRPPRVG